MWIGRNFKSKFFFILSNSISNASWAFTEPFRLPLLYLSLFLYFHLFVAFLNAWIVSIIFYLPFFSQMNDWCQCYFPSLLITYDIFLWATGLLCIRKLNAAPFCGNYTKLYFDAKDLEKGLNRGWWYFWCPFFTKCALSSQYWTQL